MATRRFAPNWDYLHDASVPSLESFELSRLNHCANLRREIGALIEQWIEDSAHALLAQWVREDRARPPRADLPCQLGFETPPATLTARPARDADRTAKLPRRSSAADAPGPAVAIPAVRRQIRST